MSELEILMHMMQVAMHTPDAPLMRVIERVRALGLDPRDLAGVERDPGKLLAAVERAVAHRGDGRDPETRLSDAIETAIAARAARLQSHHFRIGHDGSDTTQEISQIVWAIVRPA